MDHYRQGDVSVRRIHAPMRPLEIKRQDNGRVVLAYGELTGHAHVLDRPENVTLMEDKKGNLFLSVRQEAAVVHEEHSPITLPPGDYEVVTQREYVPGPVREVPVWRTGD